jgi:hypothetical protein
MAESLMNNMSVENKILIAPAIAPANGSTFSYWLKEKLSWTKLITFAISNLNEPENYHVK